MTSNRPTTATIAALGLTPEASRDRSWIQRLLVACEAASFHRGTPPGSVSALQLPLHDYTVASTTSVSRTPPVGFRRVVERCLLSGAGLRLLPDQAAPILIPYGLLWSYLKFGSVEGDPLDTPGSLLGDHLREEYRRFARGEKQMLLRVDEHILPSFARRGLYGFLKAFAEREPAVALLVDVEGDPLRILVFRVHSSKLPTPEQSTWLKDVFLPTYLPPQTAFCVVDETHVLSRYIDEVTVGDTKDVAA
jgi:hypothetical protein